MGWTAGPHITHQLLPSLADPIHLRPIDIFLVHLVFFLLFSIAFLSRRLFNLWFHSLLCSHMMQTTVCAIAHDQLMRVVIDVYIVEIYNDFVSKYASHLLKWYAFCFRKQLKGNGQSESCADVDAIVLQSMRPQHQCHI
jgi:hypothetical protein